MKNFFTKNGIILLASVTVIAVVMCIFTAASSGTGFLHNAIGTIVSPFRYLGSAVVSWVDGVGDHFESVNDLQQENEELRQQIAELEEQIRQGKKDSEENERLRSLLGLREQQKNLTFETARITERSTSNWSHTLILSKGTVHGVAIGDCVVDEYGSLIGIITDVGLSWSTITTIIDTSSSIGAEIFRTGEVAVAEGDFSLMSSGQLRLNYLQSDSSLINGDLVVTSGLGGYYPPGLVLGTISAVLTDDSGLTSYAIIEPKCDISGLSEVFIITDFQIEE